MSLETGQFRAPYFDPDNIDPARLHGYSYHELNRGIMTFNGRFSPIGDPLHAIDEIADRQEYITILDAGCGTGRQLYEMVEGATRMFQIDQRRILADGVSDYDFSDMADDKEARRAYVSGALNYHVGDLNTMELPEGSYDLAYSYEVLVHNEEPNRIVENLWRALRPGGSAYFNAEANQIPAISETIEAIKTVGGKVLSTEAEVPALTRTEAQVRNLPMPRRMLYRVIRSL